MPVEQQGELQTARYFGGGRLELLPSEVKAPDPGEVQVRTGYVGLCGTDIHLTQGHMDSRVADSVVFGHEMSGIVHAIGDGVDGWQLGDPVTVMPLIWDGSCVTCRRGHVHVCENLRFLGIDEDGALQPFWNVPADRLVALPPELPLATAALVEPLAVAIHDIRRAELKPGQRVAVIGGGPVGALIALAATSAGAEVVLSEVDEHRRALLAGLGIVTANGADPAVLEEIRLWASRDGEGGNGLDVVFEVSGSAAGLTAAIDLARTRGTVIAVGIHSQPREIDFQKVFLRELAILGARVYGREDFEAAVALLNSGAIPSDQLITAILPVSRVQEAFNLLASGTAMKVLIEVSGEQDER